MFDDYSNFDEDHSDPVYIQRNISAPQISEHVSQTSRNFPNDFTGYDNSELFLSNSQSRLNSRVAGSGRQLHHELEDGNFNPDNFFNAGSDVSSVLDESIINSKGNMKSLVIDGPRTPMDLIQADFPATPSAVFDHVMSEEESNSVLSPTRGPRQENAAANSSKIRNQSTANNLDDFEQATLGMNQLYVAEDSSLMHQAVNAPPYHPPQVQIQQHQADDSQPYLISNGESTDTNQNLSNVYSNNANLLGTQHYANQRNLRTGNVPNNAFYQMQPGTVGMIHDSNMGLNQQMYTQSSHIPSQQQMNVLSMQQQQLAAAPGMYISMVPMDASSMMSAGAMNGMHMGGMMSAQIQPSGGYYIQQGGQAQPGAIYVDPNYYNRVNAGMFVQEELIGGYQDTEGNTIQNQAYLSYNPNIALQTGGYWTTSGNMMQLNQGLLGQTSQGMMLNGGQMGVASSLRRGGTAPIYSNQQQNAFLIPSQVQGNASTIPQQIMNPVQINPSNTPPTSNNTNNQFNPNQPVANGTAPIINSMGNATANGQNSTSPRAQGNASGPSHSPHKSSQPRAPNPGMNASAHAYTGNSVNMVAPQGMHMHNVGGNNYLMATNGAAITQTIPAVGYAAAVVGGINNQNPPRGQILTKSESSGDSRNDNADGSSNVPVNNVSDSSGNVLLMHGNHSSSSSSNSQRAGTTPRERGSNSHRNPSSNGSSHHNASSQGSSVNNIATSSTAARDSVVEDFRNTYGKTRQWDIKDLVGHVVAFCQDQHGSRFIQQRLEVAQDDEKQLVFEEVQPAAHSLMTDVFGNYVIQKLFEYGTPAQCETLAILLMGQAVPLALQMYGCRVIQKALEYVNTDRLIILVQEFEGQPQVLRCVHDQNGNHVIQKCIEVISRLAKEAPPEQSEYLSSRIQFIISAFTGRVRELSMHPYGCRVVQRILEHCTNQQKSCILDELRQCCNELIQDQYGNYVIQHVMQHGWEPDRQKLVKEVQSRLLEYSQHKFASNVVEKCLQFADPKDRDEMIWTIINVTFDLKNPVDANTGQCVLESMVRDPYANYVVQKVIDVSHERQRAAIIRYVRENIVQLRRYTYGKHIIIRLEKVSGEKF